MTHVCERMVIGCPYAAARDYLRERIQRAMAQTQPQIVRLTLSKRLESIVHKDVELRYGEAIDPLRFDEPWAVHWSPLGGGLHPEFDGEIVVRLDRLGTLLELCGHYVPPLGAPGAVIDLIAGSRIAGLTARALLRRIAVKIEDMYSASSMADSANRNRA